MTERTGGRVLIADDEADIRLIVGLNLEVLGLTHGGAGDGQEAIEMLRDEDWDGFIVDIAMPKINGLQVLEWLSDRGLDDRLALVVLSAKGSPAAALQALELGAHAHLSKPFSPPAVAKMVHELLLLSPEERAARRYQMLERAGKLNRLGIPTV